MTGSAIDEMAPGRIVMGLGTGLPLRLKQMGIPYAPDAAVERCRRRWTRSARCGRANACRPPHGLPPIQPMFAPPHRIPLFIAAYRKEFVALAGQKADGYLARPAESVPSLRGIIERLRGADRGARPERSRPPATCSRSWTRRAARRLNRAKREPFVIYMMSVLGRRVAGPRRLRPGAARPHRGRLAAEDFHTAGNLIPDELLDAFMLCGTREDVAAGAMRYHAEANLELPLLQPVLQEEAQIDELLAAARLFAAMPAHRPRRGERPAWRPATAGASPDADADPLPCR